VERTLGFSTRYLEDRDIRLVQVSCCTCWIGDSIYTFLFVWKAHTIRLIEVTHWTYWIMLLVTDFNLSQKTHTFWDCWETKIIYLPLLPQQSIVEWQPYIPLIFDKHIANQSSCLFGILTCYCLHV
jgi:predicted phosphoadenosine phosphosulfate sulfurtransferase